METRHRLDGEWVCHPDPVQDGDSHVGLRVDQEGRFDVVCLLQRRLFTGSHSSGFSTVSSVCDGESGVPVLGFLFRPVVSTTGAHQSLLPGIGVGSSMGDSPPPVFG